MRRRLLDLFCGAGGCSVGYHRAGFDVEGWDIEPHPDYPYLLTVGDAMEALADRAYLSTFDVVHASPPCPRYSTATPADARDRHPDLVAPVRDALRAWGGTYVIENVPGAPLDHPVIYCGKAMSLPRIKRHRLFESSAWLMSPGCACDSSPVVGVYGAHADRPGGWSRPDGTSRGTKATSVADAGDALGIDWMTSWGDLSDAIPPAYTEHIGAQLLEHLEVA